MVNFEYRRNLAFVKLCFKDGNLLTYQNMYRTYQISLLSSLFKKSLSIGQELQDKHSEQSNGFHLSHQSLFDSTKNFGNSKNSIQSSKLYLDSELAKKSRPVLIETLSKSHSSRDIDSMVYDGATYECSSCLEIPISKENQYTMDKNKCTEFKDKKHSFRRSKSWAKYHGTHSKNRETRIHRRSRSDLGGLILNPLNEFKPYMDVSELNDPFKRFG